MSNKIAIIRDTTQIEESSYENYGAVAVKLEDLIEDMNESESTEKYNLENWKEGLKNWELLGVFDSWLPDELHNIPVDDDKPDYIQKQIDEMKRRESAIPLQDPVSVIKISDGTVVDNVYRIDLPDWEREGYEIYLPSLTND